MFPSIWEVLERDLKALRAFATTGESLRKLVFAQSVGLELDNLQQDILDIRNNAPNNAEWRIAEHAASIGRLYAVYEHFVEELLSKWLMTKTRGVAFSALNENLRKSYESFFAAMLDRAGDGRYDYLSYETMIADQAKAYSGDVDWRIYPECLIHHEKNLRFDTLNEVATRCGVTELSNWFGKSWHLAEYFGDRKSISERTQNELRQIVQYRNSAAHAHTSIDETLGLDQFLQYVDFIEALCRAFYERVMWMALADREAAQTARPIGKVSEVFSPRTRSVIIVEGVTLRKGDIVMLRSDSSCAPRIVLTLQDDGNPIDEITVAKPKAVGIGFDIPVRLNDQVLLLQPAS